MVRAQRAELALGLLLATMLIGLAVLIKKFEIKPVEGVTVLSQLADASLGHGFGYYVVQFSTVILLALAANTSYGGLPVLSQLLAKDHFLPHIFKLRGPAAGLPLRDRLPDAASRPSCSSRPAVT